MKIDIFGHGYVPGLNTMAPLMGYEADEAFVRRMTNFSGWRIYESETGRYICKENVDSFFNGPTGGGSGGECGCDNTAILKEIQAIKTKNTELEQKINTLQQDFDNHEEADQLQDISDAVATDDEVSSAVENVFK